MPTYWVAKLTRHEWYRKTFHGTPLQALMNMQNINRPGDNASKRPNLGTNMDCRAKRTHRAAQHLSTSLPFFRTQLTFQHVPTLSEQQLRYVQTSTGPVLCCQSLFAAGAKLIQHKRSSMPMWEQERCMPWNLSQVDLKLRLCMPWTMLYVQMPSVESGTPKFAKWSANVCYWRRRSSPVPIGLNLVTSVEIKQGWE